MAKVKSYRPFSRLSGNSRPLTWTVPHFPGATGLLYREKADYNSHLQPDIVARPDQSVVNQFYFFPWLVSLPFRLAVGIVLSGEGWGEMISLALEGLRQDTDFFFAALGARLLDYMVSKFSMAFYIRLSSLLPRSQILHSPQFSLISRKPYSDSSALRALEPRGFWAGASFLGSCERRTALTRATASSRRSAR